MRTAICFLVLSFSFTLADDSRPTDLSRTEEVLSREINRILEQTGIPSVSIALLKEDRILWNAAFGHANVRLRVPASPETVYSTGSCFKPITATAVMQLVDAGKIQLDDPINDYFGEHAVDDRSADGKPVTVRHLLSHYSGLTTEPEAAAGGRGAESVPLWSRSPLKPLHELPSLLTATSDPGQTFRYSNYGYSLAGLLIEKVSGADVRGLRRRQHPEAAGDRRASGFADSGDGRAVGPSLSARRKRRRAGELAPTRRLSGRRRLAERSGDVEVSADASERRPARRRSDS